MKIKFPGTDCDHSDPDLETWLDRSVCPSPCGSAHDRCIQCGGVVLRQGERECPLEKEYPTVVPWMRRLVLEPLIKDLREEAVRAPEVGDALLGVKWVLERLEKTLEEPEDPIETIRRGADYLAELISEALNEVETNSYWDSKFRATTDGKYANGIRNGLGGPELPAALNMNIAESLRRQMRRVANAMEGFSAAEVKGEPMYDVAVNLLKSKKELGR